VTLFTHCCKALLICTCSSDVLSSAPFAYILLSTILSGCSIMQSPDVIGCPCHRLVTGLTTTETVPQVLAGQYSQHEAVKCKLLTLITSAVSHDDPQPQSHQRLQCQKPCPHCMQHYPARLHQLYLVDLPVVLKWVVAAVKPVLHAETRAKIQVCQLPSPVFPFPSSILDFISPLKRISLPSAAHTSGGQVSPLIRCLL